MALPQNDPPSVVLVPPNQTSLLLGSRFRALNESPYDFSTNLTAGVVARQFTYRMLYWSSSFFTHNLTNIEILLRFQNDDRNTDPSVSPYTYVAYMQPWTQITSFDGHEGNYNSFFNEPLPGSYAAYLQASLNDLRRYESNLAHFPVTVNDGHTITAKVRYNPSRGFVIWFIDDVTQEEVPFLMLDCDWIDKGHFIHGFGLYDVTYKKWRPLFYNAPSAVYRRAYYSDSAPTLLYSRYNIVKSRELNRDRRVQSFCSSQASEDFPQEIALIPNSYQKVGSFHTEYIGDDATIIPVRNGTQAQFVRITIRDEFGNDLIAGDPIGNFMADPGVPYSVIHDYFDASSSFQSSNLLNYLIFQKLYEPSPDSRTQPEGNVVTMFEYNTVSTSYPWYAHTSYSPIYFLPYYNWDIIGNPDDAIAIAPYQNFEVTGTFHEIPRQPIKDSPSPGNKPTSYYYKSTYDPYLSFSIKNNVPMIIKLEMTHWCGESHSPWDETSPLVYNYYVQIRFYQRLKGDDDFSFLYPYNIPANWPNRYNPYSRQPIISNGNTFPCRYMEKHTDTLIWDIPQFEFGQGSGDFGDGPTIPDPDFVPDAFFVAFQFNYDVDSLNGRQKIGNKQPDMRFTYNLTFTRKNPDPPKEDPPPPPPPPPIDPPDPVPNDDPHPPPPPPDPTPDPDPPEPDVPPGPPQPDPEPDPPAPEPTPQPTYTVNDFYAPIPSSSYPYCDYRTVLLDDDIIHKINVLPSF